MKVLVTGAAGFIGFHLTLALLNRDDEVVGIDNLNNYYDPALKNLRLNEIAKHPRCSKFEFIKADISDRALMEELFSDHSFDVVVNLAAQAGVRYSLENPHAYVDSNLVGFVNILEGCRHSKVKHLVYASSSSVYGMNVKQPFSTDDRVDYPISLYAATKKSNELMAHSYSHLYNIPTTGLRFFTVYGPYGRPDMAYYKFTKAILNDDPIDVYNNGDMKRDFTYIDDIIEGIIGAMGRIPERQSNELSLAIAPYKIYNIGNNKPVTLRSFIRAIEDACGKSAVQNLLPMQPGDVPITFANVSALIADVGFKPTISIEDGISEFVRWYCEHGFRYS
ncbi:NAD-dependent epimerase [Gammaproteobacteria bacterium]|nr:NAD-dependent epimerase [Gammaproteobacteria bacterium]